MPFSMLAEYREHAVFCCVLCLATPDLELAQSKSDRTESTRFEPG
jgi:hypothetical protein